jgi:hypothetical protein
MAQMSSTRAVIRPPRSSFPASGERCCWRAMTAIATVTSSTSNVANRDAISGESKMFPLITPRSA